MDTRPRQREMPKVVDELTVEDACTLSVATPGTSPRLLDRTSSPPVGALASGPATPITLRLPATSFGELKIQRLSQADAARPLGGSAELLGLGGPVPAGPTTSALTSILRSATYAWRPVTTPSCCCRGPCAGRLPARAGGACRAAA